MIAAALSWSRERGCTTVEVETQQINVAACRFYERMGFALASVDRAAYDGLPGETQLMWRLDLGSWEPSE